MPREDDNRLLPRMFASLAMIVLDDTSHGYTIAR